MILVTGATGHVRRAVVCRLAPLGHDVVAMVSGLPGRKQAVFRQSDDVLTVHSGKLAFRLAKRISID